MTKVEVGVGLLIASGARIGHVASQPGEHSQGQGLLGCGGWVYLGSMWPPGLGAGRKGKEWGLLTSGHGNSTGSGLPAWEAGSWLGVGHPGLGAGPPDTLPAWSGGRVRGWGLLAGLPGLERGAKDTRRVLLSPLFPP